MSPLLLALWLAGCSWLGGPQPEIYVVVRGDTLFEIARDHGVTVEQLRDWNHLEGDLIEVGQELEIFAPGEAPQAAPSGPRKRSGGSKPGGQADPGPPKLIMPDPKPCLAGPRLEGTGDDVEMVASEGLSRDQISGAMNAFLPSVLPCFEGVGAAERPAILLSFNVGCDGRVTGLTASGGTGPWPPEVVECVVETLRYTPFPAHDLPDGESFDFPLRYTP